MGDSRFDSSVDFRLGGMMNTIEDNWCTGFSKWYLGTQFEEGDDYTCYFVLFFKLIYT